MGIPAEYAWLTKETGLPLITAALRLYGTTEKAGAGDNPVILGWAKELGIKGYTADSIPWCGLFAAKATSDAGYKPVENPLWAKNWAKWGAAAKVARLGDVLVFSRDGGGHVGIYVGEDATAYHVLGGNQGDTVKITRIEKNRCVAIRSAPWKSAPANYRVVKLAPNGAVSKNEA